jgi:hypothetical protein
MPEINKGREIYYPQYDLPQTSNSNVIQHYSDYITLTPHGNVERNDRSWNPQWTGYGVDMSTHAPENVDNSFSFMPENQGTDWRRPNLMRCPRWVSISIRELRLI